jgi:hypothetical protein
LYSDGIRNFRATTFSTIRASNGWGRGETCQEEKAMPGARRIYWIAIAVLVAVVVPVRTVFWGAAESVLLADQDGGGSDMNIDLAVRQVTVAPLRAHAGDVVHVEVVVENKAEGMRTTTAELLVNGKTVASQFFTWGMSPGDRLHRLSFDWNTRGVAPGEYRIGGEAFVWEDTSPFDNRLDVGHQVIIAPAGGGFPGGGAAGGSATETDPRFGKTRVGG